MQPSSEELVIVVTGANGGVGFGICHRLLVQLSSPCPSDAKPYFDVGRDLKRELDIPERAPDAGLTIVMACRDAKRAQVAREKLYRLLDEHISKLTTATAYDSAVAFRRNVKLDIQKLDLSSVKSVLDFGKAISQKYEHISHLIFNAGTATYSHLDIPGFLYDLFTHPIHAVEHPRRNIQLNGVLSDDGLGFTWQCNVFGHYVLLTSPQYRSVQPLLVAHAHKTGSPARVLWMSSLDAEPTFDPKDDWQLTKTLHSYNASKFQIELICAELEKRTREAAAGRAPSTMSELVAPHGEVHHYVVSPGITSTNMSALLNIPIPGWRCLMLAAFFIVRFLGSPHVLMSLYSAAVATVHLALVPLFAIPDPETAPHVTPADKAYPTWHVYHGKYTRAHPGRVLTLRFGAENDRWGRDRPGVIAVPVWEEHPDAGETLLERFERLYQAFVAREGKGKRGERGGEEMVNGCGAGNGRAR
ncbi:hypothetical protein BN946_scf184868.g4 [Trametes cinnabarina]|uniref:3-keto sterol reductase n=1 Tax=Pycnoporus cinnabarinus TaxID=5643 RepID=A0A060SQD2_PYCCI|nr:hypothetical protein BN946_scf184868.g4 [Trametes cinnabarina]